MVWKEGTLEELMGAPIELAEARNHLDDFHDSLEVPEEREEIYQETRELETEFEKSLFYSVSSNYAILTEVRVQVKEMTDGSGRPDQVVENVRDVEEDYREFSEEMLEEAEEKSTQMFHNYQLLADEDEIDALAEAAGKYEDVLQYARDEVENGYNLERLVQEKVNELRV